MLTSYDKAFAAALGGILSVLVMMGLDIPEELLKTEVIAAIAGAVSGILTYFVPNKGAIYYDH